MIAFEGRDLRKEIEELKQELDKWVIIWFFCLSFHKIMSRSFWHYNFEFQIMWTWTSLNSMYCARKDLDFAFTID